jgi:tetratricopeptide (TPR) repeat protein
MGRFDDAVAAYQRAIAMRPDFPDAYGNCAAAYKDKGDLDSAIVLYRKALSFKPRDRPDPIPFCNYLHCMQVRTRTTAGDRGERGSCRMEWRAADCGQGRLELVKGRDFVK